mmetsp:Transcript_12711/g.40154  ORF Transcript_12711/g.40154 Transcript_12711/m.40154 type:complete len:158 (+) Transcript_12711:59-532(+)
MRQSDGLRPHRGGGGRKAPPAPAPPPTPAPPALGGEELEGGGVARLAATAFALHLAVLLPRVSSAPGGGDSGELLAVSCDGGVAHPPGYPLFVMLARYPIGWVGIGTPAWRVGYVSPPPRLHTPAKPSGTAPSPPYAPIFCLRVPTPPPVRLALPSQ